MAKSVVKTFSDPQTEINGMLLGGGRDFAAVGSPVHLSDGGFSLRRLPPTLGGDGRDVLAEFGYTEAEIDGLAARKVLA